MSYPEVVLGWLALVILEWGKSKRCDKGEGSAGISFNGGWN